MTKPLFPSRPIRRALATGAAMLALAAVAAPARAIIVFDPSNYSQNVLTAARTLQAVNAQITSLQNQATMLVNQARNLANLPFSTLAQMQEQVQRTQQLLAQAQHLSYDVAHIDQAFARIYPQAYSGSTSQAQLSSDASERWRTALAGYQDALRVSAGVVQNLDSTRTQIEALIGASQGATGVLQSAQASAQLLALQTRQMADLTAVLAAQGRAASLDAARTAGDRASAQVEVQHFLGNGTSYVPAPVSLFH